MNDLADQMDDSTNQKNDSTDQMNDSTDSIMKWLCTLILNFFTDCQVNINYFVEEKLMKSIKNRKS